MLTGREWNCCRSPCAVCCAAEVIPLLLLHLYRSLAGRGPLAPFSTASALILALFPILRYLSIPSNLLSFVNPFPVTVNRVLLAPHSSNSLFRPVSVLVTMLFDVLTVSFALHLLLGDLALGLPSSQRSPSSPSRSLHVPLLRRAEPQRNETEFGLWAKQQKQLLEAKYGGGPSTTKRSSGTNLCV